MGEPLAEGSRSEVCQVALKFVQREKLGDIEICLFSRIHLKFA